MTVWDTSFLSKRIPMFGLRLYALTGICICAFIVFLLCLISFCITFRRRRSLPSPSSYSSCRKPLRLHLCDPNPPISKEIVQIVRQQTPVSLSELPFAQIQVSISGPAPNGEFSRFGSDSMASPDELGHLPEVSRLGWGYWYSLRELKIATNGFAGDNVIGEGGYGIVYRGVLDDGTVVAIKNLLDNRGQAEKDFSAEIEAIGRVRHKNLVRLLGYCVEGASRMLVYEYVDNGNLNEWLHGDLGDASPLTWDIRMSIVLGTAKGLAYLHEGLEPKVVHRDVKSSNILLDSEWNSKVSDFGLAKLLCSERTYVTTRVMGTFGYVAPEYASTGMLNEQSDVYSFGVLIMEIISGRTPVDYLRPSGEVNLIEWLKNMVGERRSEEVLDPKIFEKPSSKMLKRALLISLRCIDPDALQRPKMGHVVHMLEMECLLLHEEWKHGQVACQKVRSEI